MFLKWQWVLQSNITLCQNKVFFSTSKTFCPHQQKLLRHSCTQNSHRFLNLFLSRELCGYDDNFVFSILLKTGSTEIWTRIAGFRVQSANHYTIEPSAICNRKKLYFKQNLKPICIHQAKNMIYNHIICILILLIRVQWY